MGMGKKLMASLEKIIIPFPAFDYLYKLFLNYIFKIEIIRYF